MRAQGPGAARDIHIEMGNFMWTHAHAVEMLVFFADGAMPISVSATFDNLEFADDALATVINDPRILNAMVMFESGLLAGSAAPGVTLRPSAATVL